jgi:hypothetical protein
MLNIKLLASKLFYLDLSVLQPSLQTPMSMQHQEMMHSQVLDESRQTKLIITILARMLPIGGDKWARSP